MQQGEYGYGQFVKAIEYLSTWIICWQLGANLWTHLPRPHWIASRQLVIPKYRKLHQQFWRRIVTEILMATEMNQAKLAKLLAVDIGWVAEVLTEQLDPTIMEKKIPTLLQLHDEYWYLKQSQTVHK